MMCGIIILGEGAYGDEKLAKDEFGSPDCERMRGQLDQEIAKGFSMFRRECFPVKNPCQKIPSNNVDQNAPIPRDLHLRRMSAKKLNILVLVIQQWDDETPCFWAFLDLKEVLLEPFQIFRCRCRRRRRVRLLDQLRHRQ